MYNNIKGTMTVIGEKLSTPRSFFFFLFVQFVLERYSSIKCCKVFELKFSDNFLNMYEY